MALRLTSLLLVEYNQRNGLFDIWCVHQDLVVVMTVVQSIHTTTTTIIYCSFS